MPNNKVRPLVVPNYSGADSRLAAQVADQPEGRAGRVRGQKPLFSESGSTRSHSLSSKSIEQYSVHFRRSVDSGQMSMSENLECVKKIGRGGYGEVWLVRDAGAEGAEDEQAWKVPFNQNGLEAEQEKFSRIGHQPNIVSCLGIAEIDGQYGLLMEYIPGMDLSDYLPEMVAQYLRGSLSHADFWGAVQYIIKETLTGIGFLEESGYVHQDIKPGNIRVHREKLMPVIVDFGNLACFGEAHTVGTELYSPPESLTNSECVKVSDKFDTYSVGQIVYSLLAMITDSGIKHLFTAGARYDDIIACERAGLLMRLRRAMQDYQRMDAAGEYHKALTPITTKELQSRLHGVLTGREKLTRQLQEAYSREGNANIPLDCMLSKKLPKIVAGQIRVGRYGAGYESSLVKFVNAALHPAPSMRLNARTALKQPFLSDPLYGDEIAAKKVLQQVFARQELVTVD